MRFGDLRRAARIYVTLVGGLALGQALLAAWWMGLPSAPLELVVLLGLAAAWAHSYPVSTPGKQPYQVSLPFIVAAIPLLSPLQLVGMIAFVHAAAWAHHRQLRSRFALGFNAAAYISAALLAQWVGHWLWPAAFLDLSYGACLAAWLTAAAVFLVHSRVLVGGAIWLGNGIPPREQHLFDVD